MSEYIFHMALDTIWLENLFILVSRWATNLKLNLCNTACADPAGRPCRVSQGQARTRELSDKPSEGPCSHLHKRSKPRPLA